MEIERFDDSSRVFDRMNSMFDQFRTGMDTERHDRYPSDMTLQEESLRFVMDMPGFEREDIDLVLSDDVLSIEATAEAADDRITATRRINKRVRLPTEVVADETVATYRNGVLEVSMPLVDPGTDGGRRIRVE